MKNLIGALLLCVSGLAIAETTTTQTEISKNKKTHVMCKHTCEAAEYNCGDYTAEVDSCSDGYMYHRGTDILFRCDSRGE